MRKGVAGFTLVEAVVGLFLIALIILGAAPLFIYASNVNASGADRGSASALVVEQMESLRSQPYGSLAIGGSLASSLTGYSDTTNADFIIRWQIAWDPLSATSKRITVQATALRETVGVQDSVILTQLRSR